MPRYSLAAPEEAEEAALHRAFLNTTYGHYQRVGLSQTPGLLPAWAECWGQRWGIITAWNPAGQQTAAEANRLRQRDLLARVQRSRLPFLPGHNGEGQWREETLIVLDVPLRVLLDWGREYAQAAVLFGVGRRAALVWCGPPGRVERVWLSL